MPIFTVPIHEYNHCHNPAGPGGGQFCPTTGPTVMPGAVVREDTLQLTREVAKALKFPVDQIEFHPKSAAPSYDLGMGEGSQFRAAGTYNPADGKIRIYQVEGERTSPTLLASVEKLPSYEAAEAWKNQHATSYDDYSIARQADGTYNVEVRSRPVDRATLATVLAHEIQHHRFATVMKQYDAETRAILDADNAIYEQSKGERLSYRELSQRSLLRMDGTLWPQHAATYPTRAALDPFFSSSEMHQKFAKEDGVSPYSKMWWKAWQGGKSMLLRDQIYNETIAEVAAAAIAPKYGRPMARPKMIWRSLYSAINEEYARLTSKRRRAAAAA